MPGSWFPNGTLLQMEPGLFGDMADSRAGKVHDKLGMSCGARN